MISKVKRSRYLINKPFQLKMLLISFCNTTPVIVFFYQSFSFFITQFNEKIQTLDPVARESMASTLVEYTNQIKIILVVGSLIILIINMVLFLLVSHSIAGPIDKLKNYLSRRANNETQEPYVTRKNDFFPELADVVNSAFR